VLALSYCEAGLVQEVGFSLSAISHQKRTVMKHKKTVASSLTLSDGGRQPVAAEPIRLVAKQGGLAMRHSRCTNRDGYKR
jgi:hypothetical protein